jgi:hypothetical protein
VQLIKVGRQVLNVDAVASAHWEKDKLFVHLVGGRFIQFKGVEAEAVWRVVEAEAVTFGPGVE